MERENRKVLISVKVSTLLLIFISIIVIIGLANTIKSNLQKNKELVSNTNYHEVNSANVQVKKTIKPEISSRGTTSEEKRTSEIKNEESNNVVDEEAESIEKIDDDTKEKLTSEPNILYGTIGSINFEAIENSIEEDVVPEEPETISIEEVTISKDMDLTITTGLSRNDFITLISGVEEDKAGFFEENAGLIFDICKEYQINEIFFCGLIAGESGWHIAENHRRTHNYISLMTNGGLIRFSSVEEGLRKAAEALHNNYLTEGGRFYYGPTLSGVKTKFCPSSTTWINLIYGNMQRILK
ncbi:MAG: hypothetical protein IKL55_01620 [Clostridia bacterium]|nr:hypothetical protein [Clostridia bacterium]